MRFCRLIAISCCLLLAEFHPASAQIFLRLDGVTGSATETNHIGWDDPQLASAGRGAVESARRAGVATDKLQILLSL